MVETFDMTVFDDLLLDMDLTAVKVLESDMKIIKDKTLKHFSRLDNFEDTFLQKYNFLLFPIKKNISIDFAVALLYCDFLNDVLSKVDKSAFFRNYYIKEVSKYESKIHSYVTKYDIDISLYYENR